MHVLQPRKLVWVSSNNVRKCENEGINSFFVDFSVGVVLELFSNKSQFVGQLGVHVDRSGPSCSKRR